MQTITFDLANLEKRLRIKQFRIPQFQRDFTWRDSQVKLLIDSIARNYPIGSLLVLPESPSIPQLSSRAINAWIVDSEDDQKIEDLEPSKAEAYYVLDGQQRLTSIARAFLNAHPKKVYYFDLKKMLDEYDRELTDWIVTRARVSNDPERKDKNRLLRTDVVLDQQKTDIYVSEYIEDSEDFPQFRDNRTEARKAAAKIKGIFETIRKYQIPIVVLSQDSGVESVCRVFETINSTGTRLTTFDLAVARFYPNPDLRDLWKQTEERYPILGENEFQVDGERILQVLYLLYAKGAGVSNYEPTRGSLLKLDSKFIISKWEVAAENLEAAYRWVRDENGARPDTLPNEGILVSIAAFMAIYSNAFDGVVGNFRPALRRWFFSSTLQQGARQAANYKIGEDFAALDAYGQHKQPLQSPNVTLTASKLIKINKLDNRFKALQCIMAMTAKEDLISGKPIGFDVEHHHIFPRALKKTENISVGELDSIANRLAVSYETNRKLSDRMPSEYFLDLKKKARHDGTAPDVNRRLRECLIPGHIDSNDFVGQFEVDLFRSFLQSRAVMLLDRVKEVVGDSLHVSEEVDSEDDD